jgi:AcrR family transcriptional regulator
VRLLATALKLFTAAKEEVTLSAVAERAGGGIGALYRHFPPRDALAEAVYRHEVERLSDAAPALLKQIPADQALDEWLARYADLVAAKRGLKEAMRSIFEPGAAAYAYARDRLTAAVTLLLDAAAKGGAIRGDVDPQDVLLAVAASTWAALGMRIAVATTKAVKAVLSVGQAGRDATELPEAGGGDALPANRECLLMERDSCRSPPTPRARHRRGPL